MAVYITNSAKETERLGKKIARELPGITFALIGDLGSGKTTFVKGLAKGLGIKKRILSPSFVLIRPYTMCHPLYTNMYHIDLYRLEKPSDARGLGLEEIWNNPYNIVIIEWAEKIDEFLPKEKVEVKFKYAGENKRKIVMKKISKY